MREGGGNCLKYLKRGKGKRGGDTKILKREQTGARGGCLKKEGGWKPLTTYVRFS